MRDFRNRVAVITGAASGIGFALAQHAAREDMRVVVADKNADALKNAAQQLCVNGAQILAVPVDVSRAADVQRLADETFSTFGAVHLLCNNAGVGIATPILDGTTADWEWALGVNLWSVIHATRIFVPMMRAQKTESHIVNTASIAGLISPPGLGIYRTTKHAVVAFSEALYHELAERAPHVKISVLCPGMVKTNILDSAYRDPETNARDDNETARLAHRMQEAMPPDQVAAQVFDAVRHNRFYILTHPERSAQIEQRMQNILAGRNP
jgi:NAD(P)-dependent dehydrogenase (short-subunit alcohol dehydrogenase family)